METLVTHGSTIALDVAQVLMEISQDKNGICSHEILKPEVRDAKVQITELQVANRMWKSNVGAAALRVAELEDALEVARGNAELFWKVAKEAQEETETIREKQSRRSVI